MSNFFEKVFIGHLLIFFDFNFIVLDIFPDAFGWFIIASAFEPVEKITSPKIAKLTAFIMGVLTLPFILDSVKQGIEASIFIEILNILLPVLTLIFYYYFFNVSLSIGTLYKLESKVRQMKYLFLSMQIVFLLSNAILIHSALEFQQSIAAIMAVVGITVYIIFMAYLWKMKNHTSSPFFDAEI